MRFLMLILAAALAFSAGSCSSTNTSGTGLPIFDGDGDGIPDGGGGGQTDSAFDVTVSGGINPSYTWEGGEAHSVSVMRTSNPGMPVWSVAALSLGNGILEPVVHGTVPAGALAAIATETTLTPGVEYRVSVARAGTNDAGWIEFTP